MDRIKWNEKSLTLRSLVENNVITKPALVVAGERKIVVGEKFNGEFLVAAPCRLNGDRRQPIEKEILISSRNPAIWKIISKQTSKQEGHIHRLSTKDIENIHKQDIESQRTTSRRYICMKDVEAFELLARNNDSAVLNGQRIDRKLKTISQNIEFRIMEVGEIEYTPTEGELTSQDYVTIPRARSESFVNFLIPGLIAKQHKIRNRALRSISCVTTNENKERGFFLDVNEQPCDIRPIASEGSTELRYLQSTKNLYDYLLKFGNDTTLIVKLVRGEIPSRAFEFNGYLAFRGILTGDRVPVCSVEDFEISLISPDAPVRVRLPVNDSVCRTIADVRAAEHQCAQLSLALFSRHESEFFVNVESDRSIVRYLSHEPRLTDFQSSKAQTYQKRSSSATGKKEYSHSSYAAGSSSKGQKKTSNEYYSTAKSSTNYKKSGVNLGYQDFHANNNYKGNKSELYQSGATGTDYKKASGNYSYQSGMNPTSNRKPNDEQYRSSKLTYTETLPVYQSSSKANEKDSKSNYQDSSKYYDAEKPYHSGENIESRSSYKAEAKYIEMGSRFDSVPRTSYRESKKSPIYYQEKH